MKQLLAHYDRKTGYYQELDKHLEQVACNMARGLLPVQFDMVPDLPEYLRSIGMAHDLGKATTWFQEHLIDDKYSSKSSHSMVSALMLAERQECRDLLTLLAMIAVKCHHGSLSTEHPSTKTDGRLWELAEEQYRNVKQQLEGSRLSSYVPNDFSNAELHKFWLRTMKHFSRKNIYPQPFFLLQYTFSKLISADKLDSAELTDAVSGQMNGDVEKVLESKRKGSKINLNSDRDRIRETVLQGIKGLSDEEIAKKRIFTITAPTGTGKTITGASAAIVLADRIETAFGYRSNIISAVPFINILEQSADDYRDIFGDVLVHYGASDPAEQFTDKEDMPLKDKLLLINSWEAPVIMTTFVQLFESILTNQNSRLIKLNRLAGAIVILDEVQALDARYYPLLAAVMDCISKYYGTRFILMTATQPKLFSTTREINYTADAPVELLPDNADYFTRLTRTKLIPRWDIADFEILADEIELVSQEYNSVLCVVNTIQDSIDLFNMLRERGIQVLYLSTNIISMDRRAVIQKAKKWLLDGKQFVMVSTQTIEAGVDLDFDAAFRDLAPMESIIQTAGRVNRSGDKADYSPVYVFDTKSCTHVYSSMAYKTIKATITEPVRESNYQAMISDYFDKMLKYSTQYNTVIYKEGILKLNYEEISSFRMIEEQNRRSVLIIKNDDVEDEIEELCEFCRQDERGYEWKAELKRKLNRLGQYIVDVSAKKLENVPVPAFKDVYSIDLNYYVVTQDDLEKYYDPDTGFIANNVLQYFF